jgi:2-dehydropantoate 2-reductase
MRILIFGAGVIGSLYGALLAEAGYDVSVCALLQRVLSSVEDHHCCPKAEGYVKAL